MTITLTREEAQQVLDAFESATPKYTRARKDGKTLGGALDYWKLEQHKRMPALKILRARLSAPEPEPVAWMNEGDIGKTDWKVWAHGKPTATIPLYAVPPQRKPWDNKVLITDEYERGVIDGMQKQMQSSVDKAVNKLAQREWQGLTLQEIEAGFITNTCCDDLVVYEHIARAIEAKLKEKNT
jgi:hypothetical protein